MTVAGVAGCCALMVTGYGIRDSVNSMVELQFDEIVQFDGTASISSDASQEEIDDLKARLGARSDIASITETSVYSAKVHGADQNTLEQTVTVEIFDDPSDIKDAYVLRTRIGHNPIELNDEGAVITERLAENLDLKKGDTFFMEDEDGNQLEVKISDISELTSIITAI
jgi:putative ABC transport system permease protein